MPPVSRRWSSFPPHDLILINDAIATPFILDGAGTGLLLCNDRSGTEAYMMDTVNVGRGANRRRRSIATIVLMVFFASLGLFLILEHPGHLLSWLPFLIVLLCPLMHIFMHRGHGGHGGSSAPRDRERQRRDKR